MSLHYKLCYTLGGSFNLPYAKTYIIILPHAIAYNTRSISTAMKQLAEVLPSSNGDAIEGLNLLLKSLNVSRALKDFGLKE